VPVQRVRGLRNTVAHETGHWLDSFGIDPTNKGAWSSAKNQLLAEWRLAVKGSEAIRTLDGWYTGKSGDGTVPMGVNYTKVRYMLSAHETFARSYAQYVAVKSGNLEALAELRRMQAQATTGPVALDRRYNPNLSGTPGGAAMGTTHWDYPNVWSDEDFAAISDAFDTLFQKLGWRRGQ
jgi:hypothetical protein